MSKENAGNGKLLDTPAKDDKTPKLEDKTHQKVTDEKPSEVNNPTNTPADSSKELSTEELFRISAEFSDDLTDSLYKIKDANFLIDLIKRKIKSLKREVTYPKKFDKRLGTLGDKPVALTKEDRKLKKLEIGHLKKQLFNLREKLSFLQNKFNSYFNDGKAALEYELLRSKAESKTYVTQNKSFICRKAGSILNNAIQSKYQAEVITLKEKAAGDSEEAVREFNSLLRDLLDNIDLEGAIICSGSIKQKLYPAIRSALKNWDPTTNTIPGIEIPKDTE